MSNKKKIEELYKELSPEDHVLQKSGMYIGSTKKIHGDVWIYDDIKMTLNEIEYIPAFLKLFDEIISNSVDESKRNKKLNIISVSIDGDRISVYDNGGIPCVIHKEKKMYVAEMLFGSLRTGSNFDDGDNRLVVGTNGLGGVLVNLFSKEFIISSCDGKRMFYQEFYDNMSSRSTPKITNSKKNHTEITFLTDFDRLNMKGIDSIHYSLLYKRVLDLSSINPNVKFYFNNKVVGINNFEDYIKLYHKDAILDKMNHRWKLGVSHSENGFRQVSFANGSLTTDGGSHVDYILNQIIVKIREFFKKKYKVDIKPSEIKNHMMFFLDAEVINPSFSSQTKEKLITEYKDFGTNYVVSDKFIQQLLKSDIIDSIVDWIKQKEEADENRKARNLNKSLTKKKVDKLIDAKGKTRWKCQLGLFEGDSATSAFRKYRTPETMGAFALKGKFMNVTDISSDKFVNNDEVVNLMAAIGLKLGKEPTLKDLRYGRILIYTDADCLHEDTMIVTEHGMKRISDVTYDDKVLTHNSEYKSIVNITQKDISKYIRIHVGGNIIVCSEDHRLLIFRNGVVIEESAKNLKYSDFLLLKDKN
jgi:DNA topoisomerase-2